MTCPSHLNESSLMTYTIGLKTGFIEFAWLESSADATSIVMLDPAVAMAADVHSQGQPAGAQWLADYLHDASRWLVISTNYSTIGIVLMCSHLSPAGGR